MFDNRAVMFNADPIGIGGHHLGGDACPPITFEVVSAQIDN